MDSEDDIFEEDTIAWVAKKAAELRKHRLETIARAICQETCAYKGEPPCWKLVEAGERVMFPPPTCDEPGCMALAEAALEAIRTDKE